MTERRLKSSLQKMVESASRPWMKPFWPAEAYGFFITDDDLTDEDWEHGRESARLDEEIIASKTRQPFREPTSEELLWGARSQAAMRAARTLCDKRSKEWWESRGYSCEFIQASKRPSSGCNT